MPIESRSVVGSTLRYWGPVGLYAALIFGGSSISNPPESIASVLKEISDKALHLSEYSILGALTYRACRHAAGPWVARHAVIVAVAGCGVYGLSDEIHQLFVPFREAFAAWSPIRQGHAGGFDVAMGGVARASGSRLTRIIHACRREAFETEARRGFSQVRPT